jgi:hypothetical protein
MDQKSDVQIGWQEDLTIPVSVQQAIREWHPLPASTAAVSAFQHARELFRNAWSGWEYFLNELEFE